MDQRLRALANRCKRRGGDCPCRGTECQALREIDKRLREVRRELREIEWEWQRLTTPPATMRDDWEMPPKPDGDYQATVINDGDGWCPHWYSATESVDFIDFPAGAQSWPFAKDYAYSDDWERIGFEVE